MPNLLILLACLFAAVALMAVLTEKFATPTDDKKTAKLQRWIIPLVGLLLVLQAIRYFLDWG